MAILHLDKIIINKITTGIACPDCGGGLAHCRRPVFIKTLNMLSLGSLKLHCYRCNNCHRKITLF